MEEPSRPLPSQNPRRLVGAVAVALALAAFGLYVARALSNPYVLDSAEMAAASFGLGVAHPPGQPLALLLGRAFALLPLGSVAFRVALSQAFCGAVAVVGVYALVLLACAHLDSRLRPSLVVRVTLAALAALAFGLSPGARDVAGRPEVYALATALALWSLWLAGQAAAQDDARWAAAAAFILGLGLSNHPLIAGTTGVGALLATLPLLHNVSWRARVRYAVGAVMALLCGAMVTVYVPARAHALLRLPDPHTLVWGDARTLSGWWWVLSARTFAEKNSLIQTSADPGSLPFLFVQELGLPVVLCALLGVYALVRLSAAGRWHVFPLLVCAAGAVGSGLLGGLDPHNPDVRGYLGAGFAVAAVFSGVGAAAMLGRLAPHRYQKTFAALTGVALLVWPLVVAVGESPARLQGLTAPERITRAGLLSLPPRAALLTGHFETAFLLSYQRLVEGQRPDVTWAHMGFARGPGYAERMLALAPDLAPLFSAHEHGPVSTQAVESMPLPVAIEASVPIEDALAQALSYSEGLWHWPPQEGQGDLTGVPPALWPQLQARREVKGFVTWRLYQDAQLACRVRHPARRGLISTLQELMPNDALVKALVAACP